tara:strand:+ start:166 stop:501 length:336 start_codon:yes stop_codon:yes gene_type:complete
MKILLILITISFTQIPSYKDTYNWEANMLNITYIKPYISPKYDNCYSLINHKERKVLLIMNRLLNGIVDGEHPEWRARQIIHAVREYIDYKKDYEQEIEKHLKEIKRLGRF